MKTRSSLVVILLISVSLFAFLPVPSDGLTYSMRQGLGTVDASWRGEATNDEAGYRVTGVGDVNGDGYDDILISATYHTLGGINTGMVYLIFGKPSGWSMDTGLASADASFYGEGQYDYAGEALAPAGDVNGDGYDDILIGSPANNYNGINAGKTYLVLGKASGWSTGVNLSTVDASWFGEVADNYAGIGLAGAGDVNGDGYDDILIGAYFNDQVGTDAGKTYLVFGKPSGWAKNVNLSNADASFVGYNAGDWSGYSVAGAGDVNGDGLDDILISGHHDSRFIYEAGAAYLFFGRTSGWPQNASLSTANASFIGEGDTDLFGKTVAGPGDVNGDGYDDILIGAYAADYLGITTRGLTYLFFGNASGWQMNVSGANANASFVGENSGDWSGWPAQGAGDVNGDGLDDIIIGARYNSYSATYAGQAYLILGNTSGWSTYKSLSLSNASFTGEVIYDYAGTWASGAGDVNGDGNDDVLVGAPYNDAVASAAGQAYLIFPELNAKPSTITSVKAYDAGDFATETTFADVNDTVYIELVGSDGDANRRDIAIVNVTTNLSSPIGIQLRLLETDKNTGHYRGDFTIKNRTVDDYRWLNASNGDIIHISSFQDPTKNTSITVGLLQILPLNDNKTATEDVLYNAHYWTTFSMPITWAFSTSGDWLTWDAVNHNVSGTPNNGDVGNCWVRINVTDGAGRSDEHNFTLTVSNTPPKILTSNVVTTKQDALYAVDYASSDDGNGTITWHLNSNPGPWLTMTGSTGVLSGTPGEADVGPHTVNISVDDGHAGWDFTEFSLMVENVNGQPSITTTDIIVTNEDAPYSVDYEATDPDAGDTQAWSLITNASAWLHIDPSTGILSGTPTNAEVGTWSVSVFVTDSGSAMASHNFTLTVQNVDDLPVFTSTPVTEAKALFKYVYDAVAVDVDAGAVLTYSLSKNPDGMTVNAATGHIEWVPTVDQEGDKAVTVKASDAYGSAEQAFTITVKKPATYPPQATLLEPANGAEVPVLNPTIRWEVSDQDSSSVKSDVYFGTAKTLVESEDTSTRWAVGIVDKVYTFESPLVKGTTYYWTIVPNDGTNKGTCVNGVWSFKVAKDAVENNIPVITSKPVETANVGEKYLYDVDATDKDSGDELEFSLDDSPKGMNLNPTTGEISWTPEAGSEGTNQVTVRVSDGKASVTQSFIITVKKRPVNNPPSIVTIQDRTLPVGETLSIQVSASDRDSDPLTFALDKAPSGMNMTAKGLLSWKPDKGQVGDHTVVVKVSDGRNSTTMTFKVTVTKGGGGGGGDGTSSNAAWPCMWWPLLLIILVVVAVVVAVAVTRKKKPKEEPRRRHERERYDDGPRQPRSHYSRYDEGGQPRREMQAPPPDEQVPPEVAYDTPPPYYAEGGEGTAGYDQAPPETGPEPELVDEPVPEPEPAPEPMPELPEERPEEAPPTENEDGLSKDSLSELDALLGVAGASSTAKSPAKTPGRSERPAKHASHRGKKETAKDRLNKLLEEEE